MDADRQSWLEVIRSLGEDYSFIFKLNCNTGLAVCYQATPVSPQLDRLMEGNFSFREAMKAYLDGFVLPEDRSRLGLLMDMEALREQLEVLEKHVTEKEIRSPKIGG